MFDAHIPAIHAQKSSLTSQAKQQACLSIIVTLIKLSLLDIARPVLVERLEGGLPLVYVIEQLLELAHVDRAARVLVKDVCNHGRCRLVTLRQLAELYEPRAVSVNALENPLPLVYVVEQVAELLHTDCAGLVAVEHF